MTRTHPTRPITASIISFAATSTLTSVAAMAACGGAPTLAALGGLIGPPSITATEASTEQALELIRRRRDEAVGSCPTGFTRSGGNCVPIQQAAAPPLPPPAPSVAAQPPAQQAQAAPAPAGPGASAQPPARRTAARRAVQASRPASAPPSQQPYSMASLKDDYYPPVGGTQEFRGIWSEGYYDYERHKNMAPGNDANPTRRSVTGGVMSGIDWSRITLGPVMQGFQIGFLSGYNSTKNRYSDTIGLQLQTNNSLERVSTRDARETIDGAFVGVYGAWIHGKFSLDGAVKLDLYDIEQTKIESLIDCANTPTTRIASTSMTNTAVASNAYYRFDLSRNHWLEPTVGVRYTHIDYGGNAPALGVKDGEAFRVQGGLRFGMQYMTPDRWLWTTTLAALLYSDVSLTGLVVNPAFPGLQPIPLVDEGKLRVMGVLENKVDLRNGYILYSDLDVRGGQDVIGFGARAGIRYQW